jgi:hypothetical protein
MKTLPNRQLKCLIMEPSGIIAAELEDELRFAFDAKVYTGSSINCDDDFDIAILDCPVLIPAFLGLIDQLRSKTRAFVFTHTYNIPGEVVLTDILHRQLPKPYPMICLVELVAELIDHIDFGNTIQAEGLLISSKCQV